MKGTSGNGEGGDNCEQCNHNYVQRTLCIRIRHHNKTHYLIQLVHTKKTKFKWTVKIWCIMEPQVRSSNRKDGLISSIEYQYLIISVSLKLRLKNNLLVTDEPVKTFYLCLCSSNHHPTTDGKQKRWGQYT